MKMSSINNPDQMNSATPETFRFHITFKAIARMMIKYLPFANVDEERFAPHLTGNAKVLYQIVKEWQGADTRTHRKDILTKPLLLGVFIYFFDSDFREVFNFMLCRTHQEAARGTLFFPPAHLDPTTWTNDAGERHAPGGNIVPEAVLQVTPTMFVVTKVLPPRLYWVKIGETYYATDTNRPVFLGDGWAYQIHATWGNEQEFRERSVLGDLPPSNS